MKAFIEHLSGIVRAGPDCDGYGKPFDYAIAFSSTDGKTAVIKALATDGKMTVAHARAAFRVLKDIGLEAHWERIKAAP